MVVEITRGSRSEKYAAQDWICECGHLNKRKEFLIFDLPPFYCQNVNCPKVCRDVIYFNLADVEVNGRSILPSVKDQGNRPECISYALCQAQELNDVVESIILNDYTCVEQLDPMVLVDTYSTMFHCMKDKSDKRGHGLHKFVHMAGILSDLGRATVKDEERASHSDVCAVTKWSFEDVCEYIADGRGVVAVFWTGDKLSDLKFGEVYCPPPRHAATGAHAVVLIGAIFYRSRTVYIFLNSWGKKFCAVCDANGDIMRDAEGEIMFGGIGLIENSFCWNPIVLSRSWEKGVCGRLSVSWGTDLTKDEIMCECQPLFDSMQRATFTIRDDSWAVVPSQFQEGNNNYLPGPYERNENDVELAVSVPPVPKKTTPTNEPKTKGLKKETPKEAPKPKNVETPVEEVAPKLKPKNPLDCCPANVMILDEWKRLYSNTKTNFREVAIKGQEIPKLVMEHDMELYEWTNIDISDEAQQEGVNAMIKDQEHFEGEALLDAKCFQ